MPSIKNRKYFFWESDEDEEEKMETIKITQVVEVSSPCQLLARVSCTSVHQYSALGPSTSAVKFHPVQYNTLQQVCTVQWWWVLQWRKLSGGCLLKITQEGKVWNQVGRLEREMLNLLSGIHNIVKQRKPVIFANHSGRKRKVGNPMDTQCLIHRWPLLRQYVSLNCAKTYIFCGRITCVWLFFK